MGAFRNQKKDTPLKYYARNIPTRQKMNWNRTPTMDDNRKSKLLEQERIYGFNELDVHYLEVEMRIMLYERLMFFVDKYGVPKTNDTIEYEGEEYEFEEFVFDTINILQDSLKYHYQQLKEIYTESMVIAWERLILILPYFKITMV